jgi:hypothetical protein
VNYILFLGFVGLRIGRLRRGPSAIMPPPILLCMENPYKSKIAAANDRPPSSAAGALEGLMTGALDDIHALSGQPDPFDSNGAGGDNPYALLVFSSPASPTPSTPTVGAAGDTAMTR